MQNQVQKGEMGSFAEVNTGISQKSVSSEQFSPNKSDLKPILEGGPVSLEIFDPSDNQEGDGSSYDFRSDLWGHLKRVKAASFSQSLKSMKRKASTLLFDNGWYCA